MTTLQGFGPEGDWIRARLSTQWTGITPIAWDNQKYQPTNGQAYLRFSIQHSGAEQASLGPDPMRRVDGMVVLELFVPANTHTATLDDLCDQAAAVFRGARTDGLRFYEPRVVRVGESGAWFRKNVLCPFQRDTVFTS